MNKLIKSIILGLGIVGIIGTSMMVYASYFTTDTFILDGRRDLGAVIPQKGNWYKSTIKYTESDKVKQKMLDNFTYPGTFYTDRGFTTSIINGTDNYFYVKWKSPNKINSLSSVKSKMDGFNISWRKNGVIQWTHISDINESYLAGYNSSRDSSIIVYPIVDKMTSKTIAYLQYPCGNLICRDTGCTDLRPKAYCGDGIVNKELGEVCDPKDLKTKNQCNSMCQYPTTSCSVSTKEPTYYTNKCIRPIITKDKSLSVVGYTGGTTAYSSSTSCIKFNSPGNYTISATAKDSNTSKTISCKTTSVKVIDKPVCGDSIVQSNDGEECDLGKSKNGVTGLGCTSYCKYEKPSCSLNISSSNSSNSSSSNLNKGSVLPQSFIKFTYKGMPKGFDYNGKVGTIGNEIVINACTNKLTYTVYNPINSLITAVCSDTFNASTKQYCGDGNVDTGEECDFKDGRTGMYCTSSCKLKPSTVCSIDMNDEYFVGNNINVGVTKDSYSSVSSVMLGSDKMSGSSTFSKSVKTAGTYKVTASLYNSLDSKKTVTKTCEKTVVVKAKDVCN